MYGAIKLTQASCPTYSPRGATGVSQMGLGLIGVGD